MLVLTRKVNERIRVGEDITITVVRLGPGSVRIGIDAPPHLSIVREELAHGDAATAWAGAEEDGRV
jgi:carbon storage regulator